MKDYFYLGSLKRQRSHGVLLDSFIVRALKAKERKRKDLVLSTIELGELVRILNLESTLTGLWKMYEPEYEMQPGMTTDAIKKQLADMIYAKLGVAPVVASVATSVPQVITHSQPVVSSLQIEPSGVSEHSKSNNASQVSISPVLIPQPPEPPKPMETAIINQQEGSATVHTTNTEVKPNSPDKKKALSGLMTLS